MKRENINKQTSVPQQELFASELHDKEITQLSINAERRILELISANKLLKNEIRTARKLNTQLAHKVIKISSHYSFITQINQSIVHTNDEMELFNKACKIACDKGRFKMAWIGIFNPAKCKIDVVAKKGTPLKEGNLIYEFPEENAAECIRYFEDNPYYVCNDTTTLRDYVLWKSFASKEKFSSFIVLPIKKDQLVIGFFALYATAADFFAKDEVSLLMEVSSDISYALDHFESDKRHRLTEELIIGNEKKYRALVEHGSDAVAILSTNGTPTYISPSISKILGYSYTEAAELNIFKMVHPRVLSNFTGAWHTMLNIKSRPVSGIRGRMRHKDGSWRWIEATLTNMVHDPAIGGIISNFRDITDSVLTEKQRVFNASNQSALINATHDLMWSIDKKYKLITLNRPFFELVKASFGKELEVGQSVFWENLPQQYEDYFKKFYDRSFSGEEFTDIIHNYVGLETWAQISYYPIISEDVIIGCACYSRDITNLKTAEMSVKKSEAFTKAILNSLTSHIAVVNANGDVVAVNNVFKRSGDAFSTAIKPNEVGSNFFRDCEIAAAGGNEIGNKLLRGMKEVIEEKLPNVYLEYADQSPRKKWFGMNIMKFDSEDKLIILAIYDLTNRKAAEADLLLSETRLKEAQALAHMGSWQLDIKTNMLHLSDESCRLLTVCDGTNQLSFSNWTKIIHPDDRKYVLKIIKDSKASRSDIAYNYRILNKDETITHIYSESKFVFDSANNAIGIYGIMQDITERKLAEEEREKITDDILRRNEDLEQFSYIVSHNLRAPVANIIGLADLIRSDDLEESTKNKVLDGITESVTKLDEVITDLNDILQTKQQVNQEKETVYFKNIASDIKNSISTIIEKEGAIIKWDFSEVRQMLTIKSYLNSIFYNLILNSLKYSQLNIAPIIEIKSYKQKDSLFLIFKDNGMGIDLSTKKEQIFGMYKRFHPKISDGKGLGLYMVKTQVESLGGKIHIESKVNQGTIFTLEFPL